MLYYGSGSPISPYQYNVVHANLDGILCMFILQDIMKFLGVWPPLTKMTCRDSQRHLPIFVETPRHYFSSTYHDVQVRNVGPHFAFPMYKPSFFNVVNPIKIIPTITIFISGINHFQMGGVLLFYPHYPQFQ